MKKIPLGESMVVVAWMAKLWVSNTVTRWASRALTPTGSSPGVNSMCSRALEVFSKVFWFTVEFGVVEERGRLRAYGAGILSSFGELASFRGAQIEPWDLAAMGTHPYDITRYQPVLYRAPSIPEMVDRLGAFFERFDDDEADRLTHAPTAFRESRPMRLARPTVLTLATLLVTACGSDSGTNSGDDNTMSATVAGTAWSGTLAVQGTHGGNVLAVSGTNGTYQIQLTIPGVAATGTFNVGPGILGVAMLVHGTPGPPGWSRSRVGGAGSITVTTRPATRAAGTFPSAAADSPGTSATGTRSVTNGSFDVQF